MPPKVDRCPLCKGGAKVRLWPAIKDDAEILVCQEHQQNIHAKTDRTEIEDTAKEVKQKKAIAKKSVKKSIEDNIYSKVRKAFLKKHPTCEIMTLGCTKVAEEVHHSKGRGEYLIDTDTFIATCRNCHTWAETHPEQAKLLGVSKSRLTN